MRTEDPRDLNAEPERVLACLKRRDRRGNRFFIFITGPKGGTIMAFRPTISVYAGGHIADIGYYRNWEEKALLYEAVAILSLHGDCRTPEE